VAYGAGNRYYYLYNQTGTITFDQKTFGGDPANGAAKAGFYKTSSGTRTSVPSAYGTTIPTASQIIDNSGNVWTISGTTIHVNGENSGGSGKMIYWNSSNIYVRAINNTWWIYNAGGPSWNSCADPTDGTPTPTPRKEGS
jgi:hypothetical protein